jgi:hypothetical protein
MSLRTQFKSLLEPELMEGLVDQRLTLKIIRLSDGQVTPHVEILILGPFPSWFTLYEVKLALWNAKRLPDGSRNPIFAPQFVFIGKPLTNNSDAIETNIKTPNYSPIEMLWMSSLSVTSKQSNVIELISPISLMTGPPDSRFVDSAGGQKAIGKDNRIRMTLNDIFQLDDGKIIPELHVFLYADLVDRIPGPRPLGERDVYGRIMPYFPFLDPVNLPAANGAGAITQILVNQADQTTASLKQILYLEELLQTLGGEYQLPKLDGVKFLRWVWNQTPVDWEGAAILFFGIKVTHERPFMRLFPGSGQPLTKIKVRGVLPIPDIPDPNLLLGWKQDKNPDLGKDCAFIKLRLQTTESSDELPLYSTMRVFSDGTADVLILPPKQKRLLDPYSDLQDAPDALDVSLLDTPYIGHNPRLGQADVVFKIRLKREDAQITRAMLQKRLKAFSSIFQEIPPLPDEQPLAMLRYKGVSNFSSEDRIFAFLTQIASHEMVEGDVKEELWAPRVAEEFQIPIDEARKKVISWTVQKNEYVLAVPETKDYILNKNPGVDIAIHAQHPIYNFHIYRVQSFQVYTTIVNLLGLLITAPADRFTEKVAAVKAATVATAEMGSPAPMAAALSPAAQPTDVDHGNDVENDGAFFPDDDDIPEFMRGATESKYAEDTELFSNNDDIESITKEMKEIEIAPTAQVPAPPPAPPVPVPAPFAAPAPAPAPALEQDEEDAKVAKAFEKPKDTKAIKVKKYYIERLKLADPDLFDYKHPKGDRGYVSHCAANENRQPIVLDDDEYREMRDIYDDDNDLDIIVYPEDPKPAKLQKKQPNKDENATGKLEGREYPTQDDKEVVTLVRYGSKAKRIHYYFCPRLFCIRDRLMVRYKDFKSTKDRKGSPKPPNSCPFCKGTLIDSDINTESERDPNSTILQRKVGPGSDSERKIHIGFLGTKKNPSGMSLPCCFSDASDRFNPNDPEFVRLGLRPTRQGGPQVKFQGAVEAQPIADAIMGEVEQVQDEEPVDIFVPNDTTTIVSTSQKYEPNYYRVIQGVSVKSIVDASRIPLEIVVPKQSAPDDPKAGPQVGLLPEALDTYFEQDSASDKFAERVEIVRKLKPNAKGFLRLAVDNTSKNNNQFFLSAIAPTINYLPNADKVIENVIQHRIIPKYFIQLNSGNLVHEFFNKCEKKNQNDMRLWASNRLDIDELRSSNIPAIERIMNSYECFKTYIDDASQKKDYRTLYQVLSEPGILTVRGIIYIILEVSVEDITIKRGEKSEFKRDIKFERVRCPPYPLSQSQQNADISFIVHYTSVVRDRYNPDKKTYKTLAWEPLFYIDGTLGTKDSRHKPVMRFQRSEEASWPPIVQQRVSEYFSNCAGINRGPFTSQFGIDPNALIAVQEMIIGHRSQPYKMIRDSYNHLVGLAYKIKSEIITVPVADDGSILSIGIFLDWDDFTPAPADKIIEFYNNSVIPLFFQYRGYIPNRLQKSRESGKITGVILNNGFTVPASEPISPAKLANMKVVEVDDLEWDINRTIAYDASSRKIAFKHADERDIDEKKYVQLKVSSVQDEIEDVYQHLRVSFSNWLSSAGAGKDKREALLSILKRLDLPLYEKRKRLDILLEDTVTQWLEPRDKEEDPDIGFLRVDCLVQDESSCDGRCKWVSRSESDSKTEEPIEGPGRCLIHTPAKINPNGVTINVPRMLYLRLVDELIRYASKREEIFSKQVPRLTIRQESQRRGDQYIIPEGTPDWNSWWELLRSEWILSDKESSKVFDEQYVPTPLGLPGDDRRSLPDGLKIALGMDDPKTARLVWNQSLSEGSPFIFLKSILRNNILTEKENSLLTREEVSSIAKDTNTTVIYMPNGTLEGMIIGHSPGSINTIVIVSVEGKLGWLTQAGAYGVKIPFTALPGILIDHRK